MRIANPSTKIAVATNSTQKKPPPTSAPVQASSELEKKIKELSEENQQLKRNIGTLYRTAKAEIKRKDDEITRLRQQVEDLQTKN